MSVKDRIAAKKAAVGAGAPVDKPAVSASDVKSSRSQRFASAGFVGDTPPPKETEPSAPPSPARFVPPMAVRTNPPAGVNTSLSRADRFAERMTERASAPIPANSTRETAGDAIETPSTALSWDDPDRPAGSGYSVKEWTDAEEANPGLCVFEVLKSHERSLVTKERDANDVVLHRSLIVHEMATSDWRPNATATIEHHGEFGRHRYAVIRSQTEREKFPWADGSKLVIRDKGYEEEKETRSSRIERFRS